MTKIKTSFSGFEGINPISSNIFTYDYAGMPVYEDYNALTKVTLNSQGEAPKQSKEVKYNNDLTSSIIQTRGGPQH